MHKPSKLQPSQSVKSFEHVNWARYKDRDGIRQGTDERVRYIGVPEDLIEGNTELLIDLSKQADRSLVRKVQAVVRANIDEIKRLQTDAALYEANATEIATSDLELVTSNALFDLLYSDLTKADLLYELNLLGRIRNSLLADAAEKRVARDILKTAARHVKSHSDEGEKPS